MTRTLRLRKEVLTELADRELGAIAAAGPDSVSLVSGCLSCPTCPTCPTCTSCPVLCPVG